MQDKASPWLLLTLLFAAALVTTRVAKTPEAAPASTPATSEAAPPRPVADAGCETAPPPLRPLCLAVAAAAKQAALQGPPPPPRVEAGCEATPPPLSPLCRASERGDTGWQAQPWVERLRGRVRSAIVLVTDPVETGDTLRFDRTIEAVQLAAEQLRYSFAGFWIPSRATGEKEPGPEPGSLVFRSGGEYLIVFLTGESALSGIQAGEFHRSVAYMRALSAEGLKSLPIAGPNFSGTLETLAAEIRKLDPVVERVRVISPSATSGDAGRRFRSAAAGSAVLYDSVVHNDQYAMSRLVAYMGLRWPLTLRVAALKESGTQFGGQKLKVSTGGTWYEVLPVKFPRGLFRLRNATPEADAQTLFTPGKGAGAGGERLVLSLHGPGPGRERVPSFAPVQVAVAQEAVLLGISSLLAESDAHMVRIVSSDVYDSLFLAGYLRRSTPNVRPYFINADLLTVRAGERLPLLGSLAMTTFPLVAWSQRWSAVPEATLIPLSSRFEVGLFNAFSALLLEETGRGGDLMEYSFPLPPYRDRPPLWLTAVGSNGYWPIALLDDSADHEDELLLKWTRHPDHGAPGGAWPAAGRPSRAWSITFAVLVMGALVLGALVALAQLKAAGRLLPRWAVQPKRPGAAGRAFFAMAACLAAAVMLLIVAGPVWFILLRSPERAWAGLFAGGVSAAAAALLLAAACAPWAALRRARTWNRSPEDGEARVYKFLSAASAVAFLGIVVLWCTLMTNAPGLAGFFFCYRSLDLLNGVSPGLPFLFLGAGLLVLLALHQGRHALVYDLPDALPELGDPAVASGLCDALERVKEPLHHPLVSRYLGNNLIAAAGLATIVFLPLTQPQQSVESLAYDVLHLVVLAVFYVLVVLTWARFIAVTTLLRRVLTRLSGHPVREAFADLPAGHGLCTILRGRCAGAADPLAASINLLRQLASTAADPKVQLALQNGLAHVGRKTRACLRLNGSPLDQAAGRLPPIHEHLTKLGSLLAQHVHEDWSRGRAPAGDFERRAAQFVALQYAWFTGSIMRQLRSLLLFLTTGFFLGIISALVYPFRSQDAMVWAATVNFVLLGLPALVCLVRLETHPLLALACKEDKYPLGAAGLRMAFYAALPVLGLIGSHFPALGRYLVMVLQPAMQAAR